MFDKTAIGFFADVLYIKGFLNFEEFDAIMNAKTPSDLGDIVEKLLGDGYSAYKKGEGYVRSAD